MSRNVRRKAQATPTKRAVRRSSDSSNSSSSFDLSDDDGYSAVEDITDSEDDDEEDVDAAEEQNILTENHGSNVISPRPPSDDEDAQDDANGVGAEAADDDDGDDDDEDDIQIDNDDDASDAEVDFDDDDHHSWAGIASDAEDHQVSDFYQEASAFSSDAAVERHVHFDVLSSDSDSTDTEDDHADLFPDIFVSQNSLDPAFRREIEDDPDDDSSASGTFWDYDTHGNQADDSDAEEIIRHLDDDDTPTATPTASHSVKDEAMLSPSFAGVQDLDGYESESCLLRDRATHCINIRMLTIVPCS